MRGKQMLVIVDASADMFMAVLPAAAGYMCAAEAQVSHVSHGVI